MKATALILGVAAGLLLASSTAHAQVTKSSTDSEPCCNITMINVPQAIVTARDAAGKTFQFAVTDAALLKRLRIGQAVHADYSTGRVRIYGATPCCAIIRPAEPAGKQVKPVDPINGVKQEVKPAEPVNGVKEQVKPAEPVNTKQVKPAEPVGKQVNPVEPVNGVKEELKPAEPVNGVQNAADPGEPCCNITAIDKTTGIVTARAAATGRVFRFEVKQARLLQTLKLRQQVFADFATNKVRIHGAEPCCSIIGQ